MAQPTFASDVAAAYDAMATLESENDFLVCEFQDGGLEMGLVETGHGGCAKVCELLGGMEDKVAVAIFRVTAVDDRGVTVSYRTKIIHVVWVGPSCKAMQRARVAGYTKTFREPFIGINMHLQIDDVGDLEEAKLEKSLLAAGGAHAPTSFDFDNSKR